MIILKEYEIDNFLRSLSKRKLRQHLNAHYHTTSDCEFCDVVAREAIAQKIREEKSKQGDKW